MLPQYEFQMTLIAPYKGLDARIFRQVAKDLRCRIKFMDLAFDEAIEAAKRLSPDTCDVVLSRGVTVDVVKQNSSIPVVPIDFSAWDLLQALQPYAGHVRNVAFFRYSTPLPGLSSVEKALGMRIKEHLYGSKNEMHLRLIQLDPADVELFVARGTLVCQWATAAGFPTLEIIDGEISAKRTLLEAVNVARARRSERQRTARFGAILDAIDEGIVVYDAQGKVNLITPSAESLLNCAKKKPSESTSGPLCPASSLPARWRATRRNMGASTTSGAPPSSSTACPSFSKGRTWGRSAPYPTPGASTKRRQSSATN